MQRKPSISAVLLLVCLLIFEGLAPDLNAQNVPPPTPQELDQLLAPVALYPDALLAQITTASTNPQEILDVDNWLANSPNLSGPALTDAAQQQGFDPAFVALVTFPTVIQMMADNIDDYAAIGEAVMTDQGEVTASIQRLRAQAYAAGALQSNAEQTVAVEQYGGQPIYAIQPANPQVVYLPQYDPTMVYAGPPSVGYYSAPMIAFGIGIGIGALLATSSPWGWGGWGWNWGGRRIYYNRGPWGGWRGGYRPRYASYRPRPVMYANRPGYRGNWRYRPNNYRPPTPVNRPRPQRPGNRPASVQRPVAKPNRPTTPGNRPAPRPGPGTTRPNNNRPVNRPAVQPRPQTRPMPQTRPTAKPNPQVRPAPQHRPTTQPRPQTRPAPQPRPQPQSRPAAQTRPAPQQKPQNRPAPQSRPAPQDRRAQPHAALLHSIPALA